VNYRRRERVDDHEKGPEFRSVRHSLPITCEHCGEVTRLELSDEQAERLARGLLASVAGMKPTAVDVRGQG
jgi:hypothetical protein